MSNLPQTSCACALIVWLMLIWISVKLDKDWGGLSIGKKSVTIEFLQQNASKYIFEDYIWIIKKILYTKSARIMQNQINILHMIEENWNRDFQGHHRIWIRISLSDQNFAVLNFSRKSFLFTLEYHFSNISFKYIT